MIENDISHWHRIGGPKSVAFSRQGSRWWTVVPIERIPDSAMPLGIQMTIAKSDSARAGDPATTMRTLTLPFPPLRRSVPSEALLIASACLLALAVATMLKGYAVWQIDRAPLENLLDVVIALISAGIGWAALVGISALTLGKDIRANVGFWGVGVWLRLERVVWQLGVRRRTAAAPLLLGLALLAFACSAFWYAPALGLGLGTGAALYVLTETYPLVPGPGTSLFGSLLGMSDLPRQLNWAIVSRALAIRLGRPSRTAFILAAAAIYLLLSLIAAGIVWLTLADDDFFSGNIYSAYWGRTASVLAITYFAWLGWEFANLIRRSRRLSIEPHLTPVDPPPAEAIDRWQHQSALMRHVPILRDAPWKWVSAAAGSYLIRHGQRDRRFYWLASGRADVILRDPQGTPILAARLGAGTGVGEIAFLEDLPRTADVVIEETAILTYLDHHEFEKFVTDSTRQRFRELVLAGQSLARTPVFAGMADPERERWIAFGAPRHFDPGDAIIKEGSNDAWIGLLVEGTIAVERGDATIAEIGADSVFGEIAYLAGTQRTATLRALEPSLVWRWNRDWLDIELERAGILDSMRALAQARLNT